MPDYERIKKRITAMSKEGVNKEFKDKITELGDRLPALIMQAVVDNPPPVQQAVASLAGKRDKGENLVEGLIELIVDLRDAEGCDFDRCWAAICMFLTPAFAENPDSMVEIFAYVATRYVWDTKPAPDTPESTAEKMQKAADAIRQAGTVDLADLNYESQ